MIADCCAAERRGRERSEDERPSYAEAIELI